MMIFVLLVVAGVAAIAYSPLVRGFFSKDKDVPEPPPPSEKTPGTPGPDNTITKTQAAVFSVELLSREQYERHVFEYVVRAQGAARAEAEERDRAESPPWTTAWGCSQDSTIRGDVGAIADGKGS
ncbi:MAG TPA: hypothetical protein VG797_11655 [Phycisphaerales bacterium]|nr:hypothetical protein [Phycisphaerales bacterium]